MVTSMILRKICPILQTKCPEKTRQPLFQLPLISLQVCDHFKIQESDEAKAEDVRLKAMEKLSDTQTAIR